jgi:hypothetical protein
LAPGYRGLEERTMSVPAPRRRRMSPYEITSAWGICFDIVLGELLSRGLPEEKAKEIAAYIAASLAKEIEIGDQSRKH